MSDKEDTGPGSKAWEVHKALVQRRVEAMKARGSTAARLRALEAVKAAELAHAVKIPHEQFDDPDDRGDGPERFPDED